MKLRLFQRKKKPLNNEATADYIYQAIIKAAQEAGHKDFKYYGQAKGIIILAYLGNGTWGMHRLGTWSIKSYLQATERQLKTMLQAIKTGAAKPVE